MSKKITALSVAILMFAVSLVTAGFNKSNFNSDVTYAGLDTFAVEQSASTTQSVGAFVSSQAGSLNDKLEDVSEKVDSVTNIGSIIGDVSDIGNSLGGMMGDLGGIGDAIGGIGDALGGIMGGVGDSSGGSGILGTSSVTYDINTETIGYIDVIPAASDFTPVITSGAVSTTQAAAVNETVDFAATQNPYTKPTGELKGGDKGDGVKWMQWMFIYTRYGLKDDGITGVFDEDTMAVVKKLQKENGLTVDGVVDDEVIDKIELLYFQATYTTSAPAVATQPTSQVVPTASDSAGGNDNSTATMIIIIIVIVLIWLFAIGAIVVLFVMKKKKGGKKVKAKKPEKAATPVAEGDTVIESVSVEDGDTTIAEMFDKLD